MQTDTDTENLTLINVTTKNTTRTLASTLNSQIARLFKVLSTKAANLTKINTITLVSWIATVTACGMYISYIPQIVDNLNGIKTSPFQPFVAAINCSLWTFYGVKSKEYPVAIANAPGIIFGAIACLTAII
ncbi:SemiSWEET family transporter [Proteus hauseri]|uniref:SemiSWEET family transporter n=1 Tax=Proteus hauseri TaxID=183417 RepID=UPI0032D9BEE6